MATISSSNWYEAYTLKDMSVRIASMEEDIFIPKDTLVTVDPEAMQMRYKHFYIDVSFADYRMVV